MQTHPPALSNWNKKSIYSTCIVLLMLLCMPVAAWLDLQALTAESAIQQTTNVKSMINEIRAYYAKEVVERVTPHDGKSQIIHNFREVPGAIPNPATMAIELGNLFKNTQTNVQYRFISDFPFQGRPPHAFDAWETEALQSLRKNPNQEITLLDVVDGKVIYRVATSIRMNAVCVACHISHPLSPKRDWQVGDVRGIQEFTVTTPILKNIFAFKYLIGYMVFAAIVSITFLVRFRAQLRLQAYTNHQQIESNAKLQSALHQQEQRNWIKNQESQIMAAMQSHHTMQDFAQKLLSALVRPLDAKVAALYHWHAPTQQYTMVASYCYRKSNDAPSAFAVGEGLVGQCVVNRSPIVLTHVPADYLQVAAGTMDISVGHIYMIPVIQKDGTVPAVIEMGTLALFNPQQQALLDELVPLIALNIEIMQRTAQT
jgi:hypothetical protein